MVGKLPGWPCCPKTLDPVISPALFSQACTPFGRGTNKASMRVEAPASTSCTHATAPLGANPMATGTYAAPASLPLALAQALALAARAAPSRRAALQRPRGRLFLCPAPPRCRRQQPILSQSSSTGGSGGMTGSASWRTSRGPAPPASLRGGCRPLRLCGGRCGAPS
jgi:hypothetical protein